MFSAVARNSLIWLPEKKLGYFPVKATTYDAQYFKKYEGYADTVMGRQITQARIELVERHFLGVAVDVGIGCGQFVEMREHTLGFDVNPVGEKWLKDRGKWCDIYNGHYCPALTFWDSLEHIKDASWAVAHAKEFAFVSIPIFDNAEHVLRSKHFKKDEHYWYFTHEGIIDWFSDQGFELLESNRAEQDLGREDIGSYAFRRRKNG